MESRSLLTHKTLSSVERETMKTNRNTLITVTLTVEETREILERYVREKNNIGEDFKLEDIDFPRLSEERPESTVFFIKAETL